MSSTQPVVLDIDASVAPMAGELRIDLRARQEAWRFGCSVSALQPLRDVLAQQLPQDHGTVFMGSGDFHHLSWPLIERASAGALGLRVVVLDNHPDNMRFPFGVHCGSWVRRVARLPGVAHVHVLGITSPDIGGGHAWENYLGPLRAGKLTYWSCGVDVGWARWLGLSHAFKSFASAQALADTACDAFAREAQPTYLSIDKDVFSTDVVQTNWDQGRMLEPQAQAVVASLRGQLVGSDITGEISSHRYATWWKRWLSAQDGQDTVVPPDALAGWQAGQQQLNARLLGWIAGA